MLPKETCEFIEQKLINVTDKVTVIVPVYNVSSFLSKCIESICGQEYPFLEIILVDDVATGQWICFVDGDDYIMPEYVSYMLALGVAYDG